MSNSDKKYEKSYMREAAPDFLKVCATCAVVMLHTVTGVMDHTDMNLYPAQKTVFLILMDLVTWCVPVFLIISGYFFLNLSREITIGKMTGRYCRRILLALFCFGVPYALLELIASSGTFRPGMIPESVWMVCTGRSWSHLWYLYLIFLLYLLTPFFRWGLRKIPFAAVVLVELFLFVAASVLPYTAKLEGIGGKAGISDGWIYLFYYFLGYCLWKGKEYKRSEKNIGKNIEKKITVFGGILTGILFVGMLFSRVDGSYVLQMAYNYPFTVLLAVAGTITFFSLEENFSEKSRGVLKKMDELSFGVYLVHPVFLNVLYKGFHFSPLDYSLALTIPIIFVIALGGAVLITWVLRKFLILRKYVL